MRIDLLILYDPRKVVRARKFPSRLEGGQERAQPIPLQVRGHQRTRGMRFEVSSRCSVGETHAFRMLRTGTFSAGPCNRSRPRASRTRWAAGEPEPASASSGWPRARCCSPDPSTGRHPHLRCNPAHRAMGESRYSVRPFPDDEYDEEADSPRVSSRTDHSRQRSSVSGTGIFREPQLVKLDFIVEERASGVGVAYGSLHHIPDMYHPRRCWTEVEVDPGHQHRGIGRMLYEQLEGLAHARSVEVLWAGVRADDLRSVRFSSGRALPCGVVRGCRVFPSKPRPPRGSESGRGGPFRE